MTADEYAADCAARDCVPDTGELAKLQERDATVAYLRRMEERHTASENECWLLRFVASVIERGEHAP